MKKTLDGVVPAALNFGYRPSEIQFWRRLVGKAVGKVPTPFYLFSATPIQSAMRQLATLRSPRPIRHWYSCKTQPIRPMLRWWLEHGDGIEVVSEFELRAAVQEGFSPENILVNGPAKHAWLRKFQLRHLRVNFDSLTEAKQLLPQAQTLDWSLGVRFQTRQEKDSGKPSLATQLGLEPDQAMALIKRLLKAPVRLETVHFHLRTQVPSPALYQSAIAEVRQVCRKAGFAPKHLDCGGGFPTRHVRSLDGAAYDTKFDWNELNLVYRDTAQNWPELEEIWLENGRFVCAGSGVLVARVVDIKEKLGQRILICDGGRTTQALLSQWETHEILPWPARPGCLRLTTICGPTCMAFDQLARREMSERIREGDYVIWLEAGAYHIPWETRFSHGAAAVVWHEGNQISVCRQAETFGEWWGRWLS